MPNKPKNQVIEGDLKSVLEGASPPDIDRTKKPKNSDNENEESPPKINRSNKPPEVNRGNKPSNSFKPLEVLAVKSRKSELVR